MPPVIAPIVDAAPEEFKAAAALACLAPLGVVGCQLEAEYCDGKPHTPIFQTAISAPQASGKSWLIDIADRLMKPIDDMDDEQWGRLKEYNEKVKELKAIHPQVTQAQIEEILGSQPKPIVRDLGAKVSTTAMMELTHNAQGLALALRSDEADSLVKAWTSKNTDVSDMLRIGWDGGWYKQNMASVSKTFNGKVRLRLATSIAGTPDAFGRLFPNVQNGAVSRQLIINLNDLFGRPMPKWRRLTAEEDAAIETGLERLNSISVTNGKDGVEVQPRHQMDLGYINDRLQQWCLHKTEKATADNSHSLWVFHKRSAVMGFRAAILAHFLWNEPEEEADKEKVCVFAIWVAEQALWGLMKNYSLPEDANASFFAKKPYDSLEQTFTIVDLGQQLERYGLRSKPKDVMGKWCQMNRIRFTGEMMATARGKKRLYEKVEQGAMKKEEQDGMTDDER